MMSIWSSRSEASVPENETRFVARSDSIAGISPVRGGHATGSSSLGHRHTSGCRMATDHLPARQSRLRPSTCCLFVWPLMRLPAWHVGRASMVDRKARFGNRTESETSKIQTRDHRFGRPPARPPLARIGDLVHASSTIGPIDIEAGPQAAEAAAALVRWLPWHMSSESITIRFSAFASTAQIIGERSGTPILLIGSTVGHAWRFLVDRHEQLDSPTSTIAFGVNDQLVDGETVLSR